MSARRRNREQRGAPEGLLLTVEQFNRLVPVGTPVRYYPIAGEPEYWETKTRSIAWLVSGYPIAKVDGIAGGVFVSHLELMPLGKRDVPDADGGL